jgi:glutamate/tyrosine decarboxylase-like PLP-dependent enzyme
MLAATMNSNVSGFDDAATLVESQVVAWLRESFGFPETASGVLVSGGSMANLVGLTVARNANAGFDVRAHGLHAAPHPLVLYASRETHSSARKAVETLGMGCDALRLVPVDADYRIDLGALRAAIAADRAAGRRPFCVVGNAGTVNTGATDDLAALADLARDEGLWFHIDGAFGALAAWSPELRAQVAGLERADSLAFDLHKWGYVPYEAGCVLVRDGALHRAAFDVTAAYLAPARGGLAPDGPKLSDYGPQLSRGFRALKAWVALREHGLEKLGRLIRQNVAQAAYLADLVRAAPELELGAPVPLNIVCFRYRGRDAARADDALDTLNQELLVRLHEDGLAVPTYTRLGGRYWLRVAITNHRSRREDFDFLVREVLRLGRELGQP